MLVSARSVVVKASVWHVESLRRVVCVLMLLEFCIIDMADVDASRIVEPDVVEDA